MEQRKLWWKSKTLWFNALSIGLEGLQLLADTRVITPEHHLLANGIVNLGLRFVTKQSIGK